MRVLIAGAIILSLASAAFAQAPGLNLGAFEKKKDQAQELKEEEIDRAYRDATRGDKKATGPVSNDPWAAVRAAEQPAPKQAKPAAKPKVQAQAKTHPQRQVQAQTPAQPQAQSPWPAPPAGAQSPWPAATPR
jgi:hypothetical protein